MTNDENDSSEFDPILNDAAWDLIHQILVSLDELRVEPVEYDGPGLILDFGVNAPGSLAAGLALAEVCTSGLAEVSIVPGELGGIGWPQLFVQSDDPLEACLLSQYAGWQISVGQLQKKKSSSRNSATTRMLLGSLGF